MPNIVNEIVIDAHDPAAQAAWWSPVLAWPITHPWGEDAHGIEPAAEAGRRILFALGACRVDIGQGDAPWVVLADPESNEFCLFPAQPAYASPAVTAGQRSADGGSHAAASAGTWSPLRMSLTSSGAPSAPGNHTNGMPRRSACRICLPNFAAFGATSTGICLLYTSDAADDLLCVDLGGRRIIK